jgi:hypothetical protein
LTETPKRKTHEDISMIFLGKPFSKVNKTLDLPAMFLGGSHRKLLHSIPESFMVGVLLTGDLNGGIAGVLHVITDAVDSSAKKEVKKIIRKKGKKLAKSKKKKRKKKREKPHLFIVDYDLPSGKCRKQFYQQLKDSKLKTKKSTASVILTNDLKKAKAIHKKASNCGKANLYKVKKLKTKRARYRAPIS